jgi:hypothetical protein
MRVVHTAEGTANIVPRGTDQTRKRDNDWCLTRANDFVVNETEGRILEHGGNVTGDANGRQAGKDTESRNFAKGFQNAGVFQRFVSASVVSLPRGNSVRQAATLTTKTTSKKRPVVMEPCQIPGAIVFRANCPERLMAMGVSVLTDWSEGQSNGYGEYRTWRASKRTTQRGLLQSTQRPPPGKATV